MEESSHDLGWKVAENRMKRRKSNVSPEMVILNDEEAEEQRKQLAAVCSSQ